MLKADVLVIGAGAVGCSITRELTKFNLSVITVDKNPDVGGLASKSNSAIIHTGYDASPGSLESELVVAANPMYDKIAADLDVPFSRIGAILPAITDEQFEMLPMLKEKAFRNRVYDIEYLSKEQIRKMEPNITDEVKGGLYIPRESIIDPFLLVVAYAENAVRNGATFLLNTEVTGIETKDGKVIGAHTSQGFIEATYIINATGLYCDQVASFVGKNDYFVNPRKGQFYILDKNTDCKVNHIVLPIPTKLTKGKLMCPTIHGNMLIGPTAEDGKDKCDASTTREGLDSIMVDVRKLIPGVNFRDAITQFAGLRPNRNPEGLHIDSYDDLKNYINISGVRSTGLTGSAAIGTYVVQLLMRLGLNAEPNWDFDPSRTGIPRFNELSIEEKEKLIKEDPRYANIVCRCETVTEGEIVRAIYSPIPATSVDAIKRRLRAGMGRCQGGFCGPRVIEILARELGVAQEAIKKSVEESYMLVGNVK
ncbi:MAG: L-2-hydroxyglutarate oxidase LhgO [Spirochaetes bacterium ADurb.Bin315]|jgi:glycerol-3-phosphate dehydrogenase|nr:MAG: L-2-hydroxyglutarate oxidase LhgO [Spirochaetes bacterium ADurb.Bin315]